MKVTNSKKLGEIAVEAGVLTPAQVEVCLAAQRAIADVGCQKQIGEIMVDKHLMDLATRDRLLTTQREKYQLRYLGDYEVGVKLGQGGMGAVYRATQVRDGKRVALKLLNQEIEREPGAVERFEREATLASTLIHPHLVRTYGPELVEGRRVLVMEYVEGTPLDQRITRLGKLDEEEALQIAFQLALALAYIGAEGIIHRDIKPGNVMVDLNGNAKLLDLGLARFAETAARTQITMTGQIIGTPDFMAPEQIIGGTLDVRTDIYALGATLYTMVTGQAPYAGRGDHQAVLLAHLSGTLRDPVELAPELSEGAVHIIEKAMATEPADRYQGMEALAADLEAVMRGQSPTTERPTVAQTTIQRTVPAARRNAKPRRRRFSAKPTVLLARSGTPPWVGPVVGAAAFMVAVAALVAARGGGAGTGATGTSGTAGSHASVAAGSSAQVGVQRYTDPTWGYRVGLLDGWTAERAKDPPVTSFGGPAGALVAIETRALGPRCPDVPTEVLVDIERLLLARRLNVDPDAVSRQTFRAGEAMLQAVIVSGPGGKVELVGYLRSSWCVHRVIASRLTEDALRAFLGSVRFDPGSEEQAAGGAVQPVVFEHPPVAVWHPPTWTAKAQGAAVLLTRDSHAMLVLGGAMKDIERATQGDPYHHSYAQSSKLVLSGLTVTVSFGVAPDGLVVLRGVAAGSERSQIAVFGGFDPTRLDFDALLAPWQVIAMAQVQGEGADPATRPIADDPASRARLLKRWGWVPGSQYQQDLRDAQGQLVGQSVAAVVVAPADGQNPAGHMAFVHLHGTAPIGVGVIAQDLKWKMVADPAGVVLLTATSIDNVAQTIRRYAYDRESDTWFTVLDSGQRGPRFAAGRLHGVYAPRSMFAHQLWLHGWEPKPGATRTLRVLDVWAEKVVRLDLKVVENEDANRVVECAIDGRRVCYLVLADTLPQGIMVRQEAGDNLRYVPK